MGSIRRYLLFPAMTVAGSSMVLGQAPVPGYARHVRGEILRYHAPLPGVHDALLVRSQHAVRSIEWETAPVPADGTGDHVDFVWMFGIDAHVDRHSFELHIDDRRWLTFENPASSETRDWTVEGPQGSTLRFRTTMVDQFDDLMGYAELRLPRSACTPGRPLRLSVVGESADSPVWYMTFAESIEESAELSGAPALLRDESGPRQLLYLDVLNLGAAIDVEIVSPFAEPLPVRMELGGNRIPILHPPVEAEREVEVRIESGGELLHTAHGRIGPVRPWTVDLVQHAHTDIGYTRPQTEILPEQVRFLDTALDLCDQTDDLPEAARFRWTCEVAWPVREFLATRPEGQVRRLIERVREGRIEVTGLLLNGTDVLDEASCAASLAPLHDFRRAGIRVVTAMQNDVNGIAWCFADWFADLGIQFLSMGQHGHRALVPFDRPTCFWWESPAGRRVLAFRADHYHTGNFLGVHTGNLDAVEGRLLQHLVELEGSGYPWDRIAIQHSGYATDNAPPSASSSEVVAAWNRKYVWPRLRCSVASDFLRAVKDRHGDELPVFRAAWPDWWSDGYGSAPRETAAYRETAARLLAVEGLLAFARMSGEELPHRCVSDLAAAREALLFYGEHTFGADESIRDPWSANSQTQWALKAAYAWEAVKVVARLEGAALGLWSATHSPSSATRLSVFNALGQTRSGIVELFADHDTLPVDRPFRLVDEDGHGLAVQRLHSRYEGTYWAIRATDVPAFGDRSWRVEIGEPAAAERPRRDLSLSLENEHYRLVVHPAKGGVTSLYDKALDAELVDPDSDWLLGQLVHERLGNREQLEAYSLESVDRASLERVAFPGVESGPIWDTIAMSGSLPGCDVAGCEFRLHHAEKLVELVVSVRKQPDARPESIYVAFPFASPNGRVVYDTAGGIVAPEGGILPGTATDWQAVQDFVAVRGDGPEIILSSRSAPLVHLGGIRTGEFAREATIESPHVFSWLLNNYWTTNFVATSEGELRFTFALTSRDEEARSASSRFGQAQRVPLLGRLTPSRETAAAEPSPQRGTGLAEIPPDVVLVSARPARRGPGVVLLLQETAGELQTVPLGGLRFAGSPARISVVNAIEEVLRSANETVMLRPHASSFLLVEPRD